ncbi:MAG: rod shape-determining protein MreC [Planctomycetes bacterium]|nr:rod shape-determining protein MreC [Planctomycetota bacterium]
MARKLIRAWGPERDNIRLGSISRPMLFTWFMLSGFILLFSPKNLTNDLQFAFARLFRWPLTIGKNISLYARTKQPAPGTTFSKESNYIANLEEQLRQKHLEVIELSRLQTRFHALENAGLLMAIVYRFSINGARCELTISRGKNDGLAKGYYVLGDNSIIGTVSDVSPTTARVKLFTDPASKIAVRIGNLNIDRLMEGAGKDLAKIEHLSIKHKINVGDEVFARKKPGFIDASMIIGVVARCERDDRNPLVWDITVKPVCDIERLNTITVIIMNPQE